jgi:hypothetical protein
MNFFRLRASVSFDIRLHCLFILLHFTYVCMLRCLLVNVYTPFLCIISFCVSVLLCLLLCISVLLCLFLYISVLLCLFLCSSVRSFAFVGVSMHSLVYVMVKYMRSFAFVFVGVHLCAICCAQPFLFGLVSSCCTCACENVSVSFEMHFFIRKNI